MLYEFFFNDDYWRLGAFRKKECDGKGMYMLFKRKNCLLVASIR
jgi:hypothetical protein